MLQVLDFGRRRPNAPADIARDRVQVAHFPPGPFFIFIFSIASSYAVGSAAPTAYGLYVIFV